MPWESGKHPLFPIFSMALLCYLMASLDDALLHLGLESAVVFGGSIAPVMAHRSRLAVLLWCAVIN
jgi:hypothetical protein